MELPTLIFGADHAGFSLKEFLKSKLKQHYVVEDLGTYSGESSDYPDYAKAVAKKVAKHKNAVGVLVCHTGNGMAITANKVKGVRAAHIIDVKTAKLAKKHNHANVIAFGQSIITQKKALSATKAFLKATRDNATRHKRRVRKIEGN